MKIIKFSLYERNDLDIIDNVDGLFNRLSKCISDKNNIKHLTINDGALYILYDKFDVPIYLCFSKKKNHSFGKISANDKEYLCIWIPLIEKLRMKSMEEVTLNDVLENFHADEIAMKHELTHIYDYMKYKKDTNNVSGSKAPTMDDDEKKHKTYFNNDLERNAYFLQRIDYVKNKIEKGMIEILYNFDVFMTYMKLGIGKTFFDNLDEKNKKKYLSRSYLAFEDMKKKYLKEDDIKV